MMFGVPSGAIWDPAGTGDEVLDGFVMVGRYRTTRVDAMSTASRLLPAAPVAFVMTSHRSPVPGWVDRLL